MPSKKKQNVSKKSSTPETSKSQRSTPGKTDKFPIVGIGASAGGLEAFSALLKELPKDTDMAYVFVQHQDPTHPSSLPDLLKKVSKLSVHEAQNGMHVEKNHLYVIPPNTSMTIEKGILRLNPRLSSERPHLPIDSFFESLAEYAHDRAIGVILSGTAFDGTNGLKAIKKAEGVTFAQDPESAKYDGMPRSAISTGMVDFVLAPEQIASEIARIATHPFVKTKTVHDATTPKESDALTPIFHLIRKITGVDFAHYKPSTIMRRIARRMLVQKIDDIKAYTNYLRANANEVTALYEDILINVTSFFRDPETFESLKDEIFPKISKSGDPIRIWVPGCATGEEAYSLAIALLEYLGDKTSGTHIQIFATDISETAIEKARLGLFSHNIVNEVRSDRLRRFFVKIEQGYQIHKIIRDMCIFARHNVVKDPPFSKLDLISCRNLLIYFGPVLQRRVIPLFHYALNPHGYLLLGSTETIGGFSDYFYPADRKFKVFTKKSVSSRFHFAEQHLDALPDPQSRRKASETLMSSGVSPGIVSPNERDILREGDRLLLSRYAPASVVINEEFQILQFRGRTGPYLEPLPGQASLNLLRLANEGLSVELRSAVAQAKKQNARVVKPNIPLRVNGDSKEINLEVIPYAAPQSNERYFLVILETIYEGSVTGTAKPKRQKNDFVERSQIDLLNQELVATKDYLQSIIEEQEATNEELRAANEEILSSNEELQSTNEEMETAKEELQSANEELTTVNEELQIRNSELNLVNSDLTNLLASVHIPIVMVSNDLKIRKVTPLAEKVFKFIPTDIGRNLTDINLGINAPQIEEWIINVIESMRLREEEVQDRTGKWYKLQIRPYRTLDNKIDGAVLALIDMEYQLYRKYCEAIVDTMNHPVVLLSHKSKVKMVNQYFYDMFRVTQEETLDKDFFSLGNGQWNIKELRELLNQVLPKRTVIENYLVEHNFPMIGQKKLVISARRIDLMNPNEHLVMIYIRDGISSKSAPAKVKR